MLTAMAACTIFVNAQEDSVDKPLGDIARQFRKKPSQDVIDNDNLSKVMDQVERSRFAGSSLRYSIDASGKNFHVSAPDVSCSLSFSANAQALLSSQYAQLELPANELVKLTGPAVISGDSLDVSIFNGTDWHVSELEVVLTLLKKSFSNDAAIYFGTSKLLSATDSSVQSLVTQPEKRSDATFLYRMRAAAAPSTVTVFRAPLNVEIGPDQEWQWAIVQAKGYPPERTHNSNSSVSEPTPMRSEPSVTKGLSRSSTDEAPPN